MDEAVVEVELDDTVALVEVAPEETDVPDAVPEAEDALQRLARLRFLVGLV
jgi:hypothetical protein